MQKILPTLLFTLLFQLAVGQNLTLDWAAQGIGTPSGTQLEKDESGNIFFAGNFAGIVDLDLGPSLLHFNTGFKKPNGSAFDSFLAKYTSAGQLVWAKHFDADSNHIEIHNFKISSSKNIYLIGDFIGNVDFDPGPSTHFIASADTAVKDIFVTKLDSLGNHLWTITIPASKPFLNTYLLYQGAIAIDSIDNIYIAGDFRDTADFDPSSGTYNLFGNLNQSGDTASTAFMAKYDASGSFVWAHSFKGRGIGIINDLKLSPAGDIFVSGAFRDSIDLDPGLGTNIPAGSISTFYSFFCRFTNSGNLTWAKSLPTRGSQRFGGNLMLDASGNIYTTGAYDSSVDFNPGVGVDIRTSNGGDDIYILKLDPSGAYQWVRTFGSAFFDLGADATLDDSANVYVHGSFVGLVDFDGGPDTVSVTALFRDIFIVKYDSSGTFKRVNTFTGAFPNPYNILASKRKIYTTGAFANQFGGGSTLDIDPGPKVYNLVLNSFITADTYIAGFNECGHSSGSETVSACRRYTSPSGNYTWTSSGVYQDTIPNAAGCDSVLTINLTVDTVNLTVSPTFGGFTAQATGATFQWLDCNNGLATVSGATNASFTPSVSGSYAVAVTQNGCTDTSSCFVIDDVSIAENNFGEGFAVSPNPTGGNFTIDLGSTYTNVSVSIYSTSGQLVQQKEYDSTESLQLNLQAPKGLYLVQLQTQEGKQARFTLVRE
jgi:hypothetical protein